jgi:hypothetical protein
MEPLLKKQRPCDNETKDQPLLDADELATVPSFIQRLSNATRQVDEGPHSSGLHEMLRHCYSQVSASLYEKDEVAIRRQMKLVMLQGLRALVFRLEQVLKDTFCYETFCTLKKKNFGSLKWHPSKYKLCRYVCWYQTNAWESSAIDAFARESNNMLHMMKQTRQYFESQIQYMNAIEALRECICYLLIRKNMHSC